jgi:hypothetical protein
MFCELRLMQSTFQVFAARFNTTLKGSNASKKMAMMA